VGVPSFALRFGVADAYAMLAAQIATPGYEGVNAFHIRRFLTKVRKECRFAKLPTAKIAKRAIIGRNFSLRLLQLSEVRGCCGSFGLLSCKIGKKGLILW
jgi:hypothetical protein